MSVELDLPVEASLPFNQPKSPFEEGFNSASIRDGGETLPCPYEAGSADHDEWWDGFSWFDDTREA